MYTQYSILSNSHGFIFDSKSYMFYRLDLKCMTIYILQFTQLNNY